MHGEKVCIVMDEVDGMSAGDRGGIADLIKVIQGSRVPIVCICNDKYSQKLRSLKNHTLMVRVCCLPREPHPALKSSRR